MKIPNKIKIGGIIYEVQKVDSCVVDGMECFGSISSSKQLIELVSDMEEGIAQSVLIHEILHGVFDFMGIARPVDEEEDLVERISTALHMIIIDNPEMFKGD